MAKTPQVTLRMPWMTRKSLASKGWACRHGGAHCRQQWLEPSEIWNAQGSQDALALRVASACPSTPLLGALDVLDAVAAGHGEETSMHCSPSACQALAHILDRLTTRKIGAPTGRQTMASDRPASPDSGQSGTNSAQVAWVARGCLVAPVQLAAESGKCAPTRVRAPQVQQP